MPISEQFGMQRARERSQQSAQPRIFRPVKIRQSKIQQNKNSGASSRVQFTGT
jgi:hypothetical protein